MRNIFKINELIDVERYYDYEFIKKNKIFDRENMEKWHEYIYRFSTDKNVYFVRISHPVKKCDFFTIDFVEKDSYEETKEIDFELKYNDLNQHDSMKVISTVFRIIKEYYESNIDKLEYFGFSATDKRHRIYKYVISKMFPKWKISSDEKKGEEWIVHYDLNPVVEGVLNEEMSKSYLAWIALNLAIMFRYDVKQPELNLDYFNKYVQTIQTAENDPTVKEAMKDLKYKIGIDTTIANKKEVLKGLDGTPIIYRRNDYVCNKLLQMTGRKAEAWVINMDKSSFVFINKDASYNDVYHELNHVVEKFVKIDQSLLDLFDFNYNYNQQNYLYNCLTNNEYQMTKSIPIDHIEYIKQHSEIYVRLNNLKMFLYKRGYLKSPVAELTEDIFTMLYRGKVYTELNEKDKEILREADFIELLVFLDIKRYKNVTRYVNFTNQIVEGMLNEELFETEKTYDYSFYKKRKMRQFTDYIYTFTSRDNIEYYVTVTYNEWYKSMSVKFTDKKNFKGLLNRIRDRYENMDKHDAINVLNTVVKICKDFYDKSKEPIDSFTTNTYDEKRTKVYKYILSKYFKGWIVNSRKDDDGQIIIDCEKTN